MDPKNTGKWFYSEDLSIRRSQCGRWDDTDEILLCIDGQGLQRYAGEEEETYYRVGLE